MRMDPIPNPRLNYTVPTVWLWVTIAGALLLLLSWLFRFPWG